MPLDDTGFGSGSNYQGMLIVPQQTMDHYGHGSLCIESSWIDLATQLLARKLNVSPLSIYVTAAIEVTTGHLNNHQEKICVLGVPPMADHVENTQTLRGEWIHSDLALIRDFPGTVERMTREGRKFDVAIVTPNIMSVLLCETDPKASKGLDTLTLRPPSGGASLPFIMLGY